MIRRILKWLAVAIVVGLGALFAYAYSTSDNACSDPKFATPEHRMKAIIYCEYGLADVLKLADVEKPVPADDQVLVRVRAAAVNPLDWHYMRGTPYLMRLAAGLRVPSDVFMGVDFAGTVESVGAKVTRFKAGDDVFGVRGGAFGEYVSVTESRSIVPKPANITFEEAAALPVAAVTALQGLRDRAKVKPGEKVLINGASGGVGTYAVQIAKVLGAEVTGVCSTRNVELVRSLGADHVVDYKQSDYTQGDAQYDVIIDNVGNRSLSENRRVLKAGGRYVLIGGGGPDNGKWIGPMANWVKAPIYSWFISQQMGTMLAETNPKDLGVLAEMLQSGKIKSVIDRTYPLSQTPEAIRYLEEGHARGKVIVTLE